jgi:YidC/Oxa1 family membrane protein insertase
MKEIARQVLYIPCYNLLIFFAWMFHGSVGWAIVVLTVIIRLILLPSSIKAAKSALKMQMLQPKMNEIKTRHKGDQKKMNEETMKLYKEEGVSPLGSCLPMLIQLPILLILYRVFMVGFDTSRYSLLYSFVPRPETINAVFFGINLAQKDPWVLPIIAGVSQLVLSWMTLPKQKGGEKSTDPMQMMTKQMMFLFPIMTVFIARSLPAGLPIYWIVTTIFGIGQQWYVNSQLKAKSEKLKVKDIEPNRHESSPQIDTNNKASEAKEAIKAPEAPAAKKKGWMDRVMKGRLDKKDKKLGVEVTVRKKS